MSKDKFILDDDLFSLKVKVQPMPGEQPAGPLRRMNDVLRGGPGSGHFDHEGRPGEVGGSQPSGESGHKLAESEPTYYELGREIEGLKYDRDEAKAGGYWSDEEETGFISAIDAIRLERRKAMVREVVIPIGDPRLFVAMHAFGASKLDPVDRDEIMEVLGWMGIEGDEAELMIDVSDTWEDDAGKSWILSESLLRIVTRKLHPPIELSQIPVVETNSSYGEFDNATAEVLRQFELEHGPDDTQEHGIAIGSDGRILFVKEGTERYIEMPDDDVKQLKHGTFVHNHPTNSGPSWEDFKVLLATRGPSTMIANSEDNRHVVSLKRAMEAGDRNALEQAFSRANKGTRAMWEEYIKDGDMTIAEANLLHQYRVFSAVASAYPDLLDYRMERSHD